MYRIFPKQTIVLILGITLSYFLGTLIMESYKSFAKDKSDYLLPNRGEIISQDKPKSERPKPVPHKSSHLEDTIIKCSRQFSPSRNNSSII